MIARFLEDNDVPQMAAKGRIQRGGLPSTGILYVLVNGTLVVRDSETVDDRMTRYRASAREG